MNKTLSMPILPLFSLSLLVCFFSLNSQASSCFPYQVLIEDEELIDEVSSMQIVDYKISSHLKTECDGLPLERRLNVQVAHFSPQAVDFSIETSKRGEFKGTDMPAWNLRINASYFNKASEPTLFLKDGSTSLGRPLSNRGGVFHCGKNSCDITPASRYEESENHRVAVQATPRLIQRSDYISGVHSPNRLDERMILAIDQSGDVLILYSRLASFNEIRRFLLTELKATEAVALDGGSSTSFHSLSRTESGEEFQIDDTHFFWVKVPYFINFSWPL